LEEGFFSKVSSLQALSYKELSQLPDSYVSPTKRFLARTNSFIIFFCMQCRGLSLENTPLFVHLINQETPGFIGYHATCSNFRLFQDLIRWIIEEKLQLSIREDFHFLRIPGEGFLTYHSSQAFLSDVSDIEDSLPHIRPHLLSLNISLFQSYYFMTDFTPRFFIQNTTAITPPNYWSLLLDFAEKAGLKRQEIEEVIAQGLKILSEDRGILLQFFDRSIDYQFTDTHFYPASTYGKPIHFQQPSAYLLSSKLIRFPQLRLVINEKDVLNPYSPLCMKRYDLLSEEKRKEYENTLRALIRSAIHDSAKAQQLREKLLSLWAL